MNQFTYFNYGGDSPYRKQGKHRDPLEERDAVYRQIYKTMMEEGSYNERDFNMRCQQFNLLFDASQNSKNQQEDNIGCLTVKSANQWCLEAVALPTPKNLWKGLWNEGEVCCLFADSNLGKSIYAVQMASDIARSQKVIYFDFEMSQKQFQLRYSNSAGICHTFPDNFLRCEIDPTAIDPDNFEDAVIADIEAVAVAHDAKIIIIDYLTYLCAETENPEAAGRLMQNFMNLKRKLDLSILVLAHTPKRQLGQILTQNDLAGSKRLFNFFDSCFAIGKSCSGESMRYVKQIKCRASHFTMGADNVEICEIEKNDTFIFFNNLYYDLETKHVETVSKEERRAKLAFDARIKRKNGKTIRQIADELGISKTQVARLLNEPEPSPPVPSPQGRRL